MPISPIVLYFAHSSTMGTIMPRTFLLGYLMGKYSCWIFASAFADAVLHATIISKQFFENKKSIPSLRNS